MPGTKFADDGDGWDFEGDPPPHSPADALEAMVSLADHGDDAAAATLGYEEGWDERKHPRAKDGKFGSGGGSASGEPARPKPDGGGRATTPAAVAAATKRPTPKSVGRSKTFDVARSRRIKKAHKVEGEVAAGVSGSNLPDSEPADVVHFPDAAGKPITDPRAVRTELARRARVLEEYDKAQNSPDGLDSLHPEVRAAYERILSQPAHFFEVKTLQKSAADRVRMTAAALAKKEAWRAKYNVQFHVVVVDERRGKKNSGHRVYVAPATLTKTVALADCKKAGGMADILALARGE